MKVKKTKNGFSFKAENSNDSKDLLNMISEMSECKKDSDNICGGFKHCENKNYDNLNLDCKECSDDYDNAMKEFLK